MRTPVERELSSHFAALRALARDLVGEGDADDLVQETALQALRRPPGEPGPMSGWLRLVVRRLAGRHRRATRRRAEREQQVARDEVLPPPQGQFEHREQLQRVTAAVLALPEPYQRTVLLRYLQELTPTAIAARDGVPLATVKSRLQRGLSMLRERFDGEDGGHGDWHAALAGVFGFGRIATVGTAAAVTTGVLLMGTGAKLLMGGAAAVVAVAAALFFANGAPPAGPAQRVARADAPASVAGNASANAEAAIAAPPDRREVATSPAATTTPLATIRGRCVDEHGSPIAGIRIAFTGQPQQDNGADHRDHIAWQDPPPLSTATDGRFEFQFSPPPTFHFEMTVGDAEHVGGYCRWQQLAPAQIVDAGDVPIIQPLPWKPRFCVVDTNGLPVAGETLYLEWTAPPWFHSPFDVGSGGGLATDASGHCSWRYLMPGSYKVSVQGRDVVRGAQLELTRVPNEGTLEVVVAAIGAGDVLSGVVVDEDGKPVPQVWVSGVAGSARSPVDARTGTDGTFRILRKQSYGQGPVQFAINVDGFESQIPEEHFAWGRTDIRLVLRRGVDVEVLVSDHTGNPIEDYRLWLAPDQLAGTHGDSHALDVRSEGSHVGGRSRAAGIRRGDYYVVVEANDPTLQIGRPVPIHLGDTPVSIAVQLLPATHRLLRVQRRDGTAIAGATVRLVDPAGTVPCVPAQARPLPVWASGNGNGREHLNIGWSILLQESTTDEHGEVTLRGPGELALTIGVQAPALCPAQMDQVRLDLAAPLAITLDAGARLTGRAQPEILQALRAAAGLSPTGPLMGQNQRLLPGILLARGDDGRHEVFPAGSFAEFADDGSFLVEHVPPDRWRVMLQTPLARDPYWEDVATVDLRDGETTDLPVDLSLVMPCELAGRVFLNDTPLDTASLPTYRKPQLLVAGRDLAGKPTNFGSALITDADGRFHWRGRAGTVTLQKSDYVTAPESLVLTPGSRATQDFRISSGIARLHLVDAEGKPVPDSLIVLFDATGARLPTWTDAAGVSERELLPGSYRVQAQRKRDGKLGAVMALGEVAIAAGKPNDLTLRLPRE